MTENRFFIFTNLTSIFGKKYQKPNSIDYSPQPLTGTPLTGTLSLTGTLFRVGLFVSNWNSKKCAF